MPTGLPADKGIAYMYAEALQKAGLCRWMTAWTKLDANLMLEQIPGIQSLKTSGHGMLVASLVKPWRLMASWLLQAIAS